MAAGAQREDLDKLHEVMRDDPTQIASFRTVQKVGKVVIQNTPIQGKGVRLIPKPDGVQIDVLDAADSDFPFNATFINGDTGIQISPGTFSGIMPTLGGASLDSLDGDGHPPYLGYDGTGTLHIWLEIDADLSAAHNYIYDYDYSSVIVDAGGSVPADDLTTAKFYIPLATFVNGVKTAQPVKTSLVGVVNDKGSNDSSGILVWWEA